MSRSLVNFSGLVKICIMFIDKARVKGVGKSWGVGGSDITTNKWQPTFRKKAEETTVRQKTLCGHLVPGQEVWQISRPPSPHSSPPSPP